MANRKVEMHRAVSAELAKIYEAKNHDYGDSFGKGYGEHGMTMPVIRLEDKLNRLKALLKAENKVKDESIDDTLMDLANYAIMTIIERRLENELVTATRTRTTFTDVLFDGDHRRE